MCEDWQVDLKNPNPSKHRFIDESSTLVVLVDIKRFNMYMQNHMDQKATPLFWYDDFLVDFPQFSTVYQQIEEMKKHAPKPTPKPTVPHGPSHQITGDKKISGLLLKFLQRTEQSQRLSVQESVSSLFEPESGTKNLSIATVDDPVSSPAILSPSPTKTPTSSTLKSTNNLLSKPKKTVTLATVSQFFQASSSSSSSSSD